jgi:hypothetical protein
MIHRKFSILAKRERAACLVAAGLEKSQARNKCGYRGLL